MNFEERNTITELLMNALIVALFVWQIATRHAAGEFAGPDGLMHWARVVLVLIGISIGTGVVVTILFSILYGIITGARDRRETPGFLTDERDRMIAGRGLRVTLWVAAAGFVAALAALASGQTVFFVLNMMIAGFALGDTAGNLVRLWQYRRGFQE